MPRGPHSLSREQVQQSQRQRILTAMIESAGELGYAQTPVAEVIARAGVSRKAFYEQFPDRQGCFLVAAERIAAGAIELLEQVYRAAQDPYQGAQAAIQALFEQSIADPRALRLTLVELGAIGPAGVLRREELFTAIERLLCEIVGPIPALEPPHPILRGIIGGISQTAYMRASDPRSSPSPELARDLVTWIHSYFPAAPTVVSLHEQASPSQPPRPLTGGRAPGTLSPAPSGGRRRSMREVKSLRSYVVHSQRERILDAVANLSVDKGYSIVTISNIGRYASVTQETFYEHFAGKDDAFLVTYEVGHGKSVAVTEGACMAAPDWPSSVKAGIAALFDFLASEPAFAHLALVDAMVVTPRSEARALTGIGTFEQIFAAGLEHSGHSAQPHTIGAIMGALFELCASYTLQQRTSELPSLVGPATYLALAPIVGVDAAAQLASDPS